MSEPKPTGNSVKSTTMSSLKKCKPILLLKVVFFFIFVIFFNEMFLWLWGFLPYYILTLRDKTGFLSLTYQCLTTAH